MKRRMVILFGGQSPEHEISIMSYKGVYPSLPNSWEIMPVFISKEGVWWTLEDPNSVMQDKITPHHTCVLSKGFQKPDQVDLVDLKTQKSLGPVDFVFIVLHGENGEDGKLQGHLDMLGLPYSGCGAEASVLCMNKVLTKKLCKTQGIPTVPFYELRKASRRTFSSQNLSLQGPPWIVKPARTGSSVGITRVEDASAFDSALDEAFQYDDWVMIETCIQGRELECSVLEDVAQGKVVAASPAEVIPGDTFYSYRDKYVDDKAQLICPATLPDATIKQIQSVAIQAFEAVGGSGFARCDFLMDQKGAIYLNELNTIPGFTPISLYPRMFEVSGMPREQLLEKIIQAGLKRQGS